MTPSRSSALACLVLLLTITAGSVDAQTVRRMEVSGAIVEVPEIGAIITEDENQLKVLVALPPEGRPVAYKNVDVKEGDLVLYLNGVRTKKVSDFEKQYQSLQPGDEVQIGLKRKDERFISSFPKADPESLPKHRMMVMKSEDEGGPAGGNMTMMRSDDSTSWVSGADITPLPGLGVLVGMQDEKITVVEVLPIPKENKANDELKKGDIIESLNGKQIKSVGELVELSEKIAVGEEAKLVIRRDGKPLTISFVKPNVHTKMMFKTKQN